MVGVAGHLATARSVQPTQPRGIFALMRCNERAQRTREGGTVCDGGGAVRAYVCPPMMDEEDRDLGRCPKASSVMPVGLSLVRWKVIVRKRVGGWGYGRFFWGGGGGTTDGGGGEGDEGTNA